MGEIYQSVQLIGKRKVRVKAFFDSGASTSYIKDSLAKRLGYTFTRKESVFLGNGQRVIGYQVSIIIQIKNQIKPVLAVAISMPEDLILGHDFFQDNDVILDYSKDKFRFSKRMPKVNRRLRL